MSDTRSAAELLPWLTPVSDRVVACKDSGLLACFEFRGLDVDGATNADVSQVETLLDTAMHTWHNQPVTMWWTVRREARDDYPAAPMPDPVSQMVDDLHHEQIVSTGSFVNRHFFSVLWMPARSTNVVMDRIGTYMSDGMNPLSAVIKGVRSALVSRESFAWGAAELEAALTTFEGLLAQFTGTLGTLGIARLAGSALTGLLRACANPGMPMVPKSAGYDGRYLDGLLSERTLSVMRDTLVFGDVEADRSNVSAISFKEFPDSYYAGLFDSLLTYPLGTTLSIAFRVAPDAATKKELSSVRRAANLTRLPLKSLIVGAFKSGGADEESADPAKQEELDAASVAEAELSSGRRYWGWMNATVCFDSPDLGLLQSVTNEALRQLRSSRLSGAVRESTHLLSAWTSTMPGAWEECRRWYMMTDANFSDAGPVLSVQHGDRTNKHFSEKIYGHAVPSLTTLDTNFGVPFLFNWNVGQSAHGFVVGPTRSGKSIGMNFLMSQFRKYPGARIVIFDRDRSCRIPTLLQGGEHIDLREGGSIKLNPYALLSDRRHWGFLASFTEYLISAMGYKVTAEDARELWRAIEGMSADADPENRRLMALSNLLPVHLRTQLAPWIEGGRYGEYFDHTEDSFSLSDFTCIEMGEVMRDERLATAVMDYAFYRVEQAVRGGDGAAQATLYPTLVYVEEASFLMRSPQFSTRLVGWLKTFAKLNAGVILTTQSPEDFMEAEASTVFAALRDNIPTRIYLPNPNAQSEGLAELYVKTFQLLPEHVKRIRMAIPHCNYFITQPGLVRMVNMKLAPEQVDVLRSETDAQRILDECMAEAPDGDWRALYVERIAAWGRKTAVAA